MSVNSRRRTGPTAIALGLGLCLAGLPGAAPAAGVSMTAAVQRGLGIATSRLALTRHADEVDAFAKILDPEPLVQLSSDLATAEAAAVASAAEARRSRTLHAADGGVAAKDLEAAVAQAQSDALKVDMLRRRVSLEWGPGVARMSPAARARLVDGLTAGRIALVRVDTHNNTGQPGARFVGIDIGDPPPVRGVVLGPARAAEPRLQSSGLIVEVTGPKAILFSVGLTQSAHIVTTDETKGFVVPLAAVIRYRGAAWVYVRAGPDSFERRRLQDPVLSPDGLFVAKGLSADDEVVTRGAGALFTAEQGAAP